MRDLNRGVAVRIYLKLDGPDVAALLLVQ